MLEVEMKFAVTNGAALEAKLRALGATASQDRHEEDHYFNSPDRDFAKTDEALRIRRTGDQTVLTYKGKKLDAHTKTRKEIEVPIADGPEAAKKLSALLEALGYRSTATVAKDRTIYHLDRESFHVEVCLDRVHDVGEYVELEIVADDAGLDSARQVVQGLAQELGLGHSERRSYLELWLQKRSSTHGS